MLIDARFDNHRHAVGQQHHVGIGHPVRRGDDHFVAAVQQRLGQIVKALLAAAGHQNLLGLVAQAVVALELGDDGFLQAGRAVHRRVFGEAGVNRLDGGVLDERGRIEIRLAGAQTDYILAGRLEFVGLGGHRQGRRRFDALYTFGKRGTHEDSWIRTEKLNTGITQIVGSY